VADKFDALTDEDVRQIAALVELLDRSSFDYLQVDVGHLKVTVGKGMPPAAGWSAPAPAMALEAPQSAPAPVAQTKPAAPNAAAHGEDVVAVKAPMIGRFYAQPEPGAAPFVTLGMQVSATTTVGLIEVMKVYTSVEAAVDGVISEVCVQDGAFVEFGAVLFLIKKTAGAAAPKRSHATAKARAGR